jgi:hypothetical protein
LLANLQQVVVVGRASGFQGCARIEKRQRQQSNLPHHQQNQNPPDAPISISEWVNHFKLVMDHRQPRQARNGCIVTNESFELFHALGDEMWRRGNKARCLDIGRSSDVRLHRTI